MWIVRLALRRPYTFVVAALLIAILGGAAIATLPVDIFPYIDIPVVSIVWQYNGLTPEEMESRIVTNFERALTANVVGIEHIESQSHQTIAVVRVYFHAGTSVDLALSQIEKMRCMLVSQTAGAGRVVQCFFASAAGDPVIFDAGKFPNAVSHRSELFER